MLIQIKRSEQVFGPYSIEDARAYLNSGRLSGTDLAQAEGTLEWVPLATVPGVVAVPPPPPLVADAPFPPEAAAAQPPSISMWPILRDVAIVWILTGIGGAVAGVAAAGVARSDTALMLAMGVSNILLGTVAFTISGCLARGNRWPHIACVALGAWATGIINVLFLGIALRDWLLGAIVMAIIAAAGGGVSMLLTRRHTHGV